MKGMFRRTLTVTLCATLLAVLGSCGDDTPQPKPLYVPPGGENTGGNTTGENNNGGNTTEECALGVCTAVQGGSICLVNSQPPAGSPVCDAQTGAGCPDNLDPVSVQDANGNAGCLCVEYCQNPEGGGTTNPPPTGGECSTGGTCTDIQGGSVCLDNGGIPAGAESCDAQTGAGCPTNKVPVNAQDASGNTSCVCVEDCAGAGTGGGTTPPPTGSCPVGTCTAIQGGNICLDNGGIPAGSETCDATTGEGCPTDKMPVNAQDASGATSCVCVYSC